MRASRLAAACVLVSRAMGGRNPAALAPVVRGALARAILEARHIDPAHAAAILDPDVPEHLHTSWLTEPLMSLHPEARGPLVALMPRRLARLAAMALERAHGTLPAEAEVRPGRGLTALGMAAALRPPLGTTPPTFLDREQALDPLGWLERARDLPVEEVFARWPERARSLEKGLEPRLVALAACLAGRGDEARGFAALLRFRTGRAFLTAWTHWTLALEPDEAEDLHERIDPLKGDES